MDLPLNETLLSMGVNPNEALAAGHHDHRLAAGTGRRGRGAGGSEGIYWTKKEGGNGEQDDEGEAREEDEGETCRREGIGSIMRSAWPA